MELDDEKRAFLGEMVGSLSQKFIRGATEHAARLDDIPNVAEAIGEAEDQLTYLRNYRRIVQQVISLLDAGNILEARRLLEVQIAPKQKPAQHDDEAYAHLVEQSQRDE